jgi:hypothetical protein
VSWFTDQKSVKLFRQTSWPRLGAGLLLLNVTGLYTTVSPFFHPRGAVL